MHHSLHFLNLVGILGCCLCIWWVLAYWIARVYSRPTAS